MTSELGEAGPLGEPGISGASFKFAGEHRFSGFGFEEVLHTNLPQRNLGNGEPAEGAG